MNSRTKYLLLASGATIAILAVRGGRAQQPTCDELNPDISRATLDVAVTSVPGGFRYEYKIVNPVGGNTGCVRTAMLDVSTLRGPTSESEIIVGPSIDRDGVPVPFSIVPGTYSVTQLALCHGNLGGLGFFGLVCRDERVRPVVDQNNPQYIDGPRVHPGESQAAFTIVSPLPPARRRFTLIPVGDWGAPGSNVISPTMTYKNGFTLGPTHPSEDIDCGGAPRVPPCLATPTPTPDWLSLPRPTFTPRPTPSNHAPVCSGAVATPTSLLPPNHKLVAISITGVTDPDSDPVTVSPTSVRQDEVVREQGGGSGKTEPDATLAPLAVRSERNGNPKAPGDGRVYHIAFSAIDGRGGSCSGSVTVCVPHDQRPSATCVDGGALFDSLVP